jgi:hypothetical protein
MIAGSVTRRLRGVGIILGACILTGSALGCIHSHIWTWTRLDLEPSETLAVGPLAGCRVKLLNDQPDDAQIVLMGFESATVTGTLRQLTDAIASHLAFELRNRNAVVSAEAPKLLRIKVEGVQPRQSWVLRTKGTVRVETGQGYVRTIEIDTGTGGSADRLYNGFVQVAVTEILKDAKIADYLNP